MPELRELFIIDRTLGPRLSNACLRRQEGRMSEEQVVGFMWETMSDREGRDSGVN